MSPVSPINWAKAAGENLRDWESVRGADAIHVSTGSTFPHPLNPPGEFPALVLARTYQTVISSGVHTMRNFLLFRNFLGRIFFRAFWLRTQLRCKGYRLDVPKVTGPFKTKDLSPKAMQRLLDRYQGVSLGDFWEIKKNVRVPVICTGGFQQASYISWAIAEGFCDAVSIARPLIANNDLPAILQSGADMPDNPCTYCNKCLLHVIEDPLGCYNQDRFASYAELVEAVMEVGPSRVDKSKIIPAEKGHKYHGRKSRRNKAGSCQQENCQSVIFCRTSVDRCGSSDINKE